jgi:hypothetical protein
MFLRFVSFIFGAQPTHDYRVTAAMTRGPMKMPMNPIINKPPIAPIKMIQSGTPAPRPIKRGLIKLSNTLMIMPSAELPPEFART